MKDHDVGLHGGEVQLHVGGLRQAFGQQACVDMVLRQPRQVMIQGVQRGR